VPLAHAPCGGQRFVGCSKGNVIHNVEGTLPTAHGIVAKTAVIDDALRNRWMRKLQQQRAWPSENERTLAVHTPRHGVRSEETDDGIAPRRLRHETFFEAIVHGRHPARRDAAGGQRIAETNRIVL
jgi:hypothetical protein